VQLNVRAFALAVAVVWGCGVLFLGWIAAVGWGRGLVDPLASLYIGYAPTFVGGIIGGVWAFFDGLIAAALAAWLYNRFLASGR